jgi:hypothetical protein
VIEKVSDGMKDGWRGTFGLLLRGAGGLRWCQRWVFGEDIWRFW